MAMFGKQNHNLLGVATLQAGGFNAVLSASTGAAVARCPHAAPRGEFDVDLETYYQSDADFEKSVELWDRFPQKEVVMSSHDLNRAHKLLPDVPLADLATIKTKCNRPCQCGRESNALDLIEFCIKESFHGTEFLTKVLTERRKDKKISIMDSTHRSPLLADSVHYLDDTKPIPCLSCGEEIHLYLLHHSLAHYWLC
jgi:hypothetical protein